GVEPGWLVNVSHIKLGEGEGLDSRPFVEVHVLHAQLNTLLVEGEDHRVVGTPSPRGAAPLGGLPLEASHSTLGALPFDLLDRIGHAGGTSSKGTDALRSASTHLGIAVGIGKAGVVKVHQHVMG